MLQIALAADYFYKAVSRKQVQRYKDDLKLFHSLQLIVRQYYAEAIDYKHYEEKIRKLIDSHIGADGVVALVAPVDIFDEEAFAAEVADAEGTAAKADIIAYRMKRTATENMGKNPAFYRKFSQMIDETIQAYRDGRIDELEYLMRMETGLAEMQSGGRIDLPDVLKPHTDAAAYFGELREPMAEYGLDRDRAAKVALDVDGIIEQHTGIDWISDKDIEKRMASSMGDYFFKLAKQKGAKPNIPEMEQLIEQLIAIAKNRYQPGEWS